MTSLYQQSIPVFIKYLGNLSAIVEKGAQYADEKAIKHDEFLSYRLVSDMQGLIYQVQSCCNTSVWFADRVGKLTHVAVEDNETTFEQLQARIERTISYLKEVDPKVIEDKAETPVLMASKVGDFHFASGQTYLSEFVIPNFHFHLSTAYCVLRAQGVPLGALDYLKDVFHKA